VYSLTKKRKGQVFRGRGSLSLSLGEKGKKPSSRTGKKEEGQIGSKKKKKSRFYLGGKKRKETSPFRQRILAHPAKKQPYLIRRKKRKKPARHLPVDLFEEKRVRLQPTTRRKERGGKKGVLLKLPNLATLKGKRRK